MIKFAQTQNEKQCCGCRACEQSCHYKAITMVENKEGFIYPKVDNSVCTGCGLCEKICPMENSPARVEPVSIFATQHLNSQILKESSSGGVFRLLADEVIKNGGCVVGCVWNKHKPVLAIADQIEELHLMQGSKYIFSDTGDIYCQVKKRLSAGQQVLFTAAPCQCAGLLNYLQKPYANLLTADFLCHGMPSQSAFDSYIGSIEKHLGKEVENIKFRDKSKRGWGLAFSYQYGKSQKQNINFADTDPYQYGFTRGYFNRYSCYVCPFKGRKRFTDFTFCDFWGVGRFYPELDCNKGVSALSLNTDAAVAIKERLINQAIWIETKAEYVAEENPAIIYDEKDTIPIIRNKIYNCLTTEGWEKVSKRYLTVKYAPIKKIGYRIPKSWVKIITGIIKKD